MTSAQRVAKRYLVKIALEKNGDTIRVYAFHNIYY